jgi:iron(III) transport system substrate-binding protein
MKFNLPEMKHYQKGFIDPEGYWVSIYILTHVIAYNSNLVTGSDIPKRYEDLLDPKWKKRMALDSEEYVWFANMLQSRGREKALSLMRGLAKQDLSFRRGHNLLDDLLAAGEFPVVVDTYAADIEKLKSKGAPVDWVPVEPVIASHKFTGISNHAQHPNAAKLFVNFLLSKKGQQIIADRLGRIPSRFDVKPNPPKLTQGITFYPEDLSLARNFDAMVKLYNDVFHK